MRQLRRGVFETNSSSVHTLTICSKEEYEGWQRDELVYDSWEEKLVSKDSINVFAEADIIKYYNTRKEQFWKNWDQLSEEEKDEFRSIYHKRFDRSDTYIKYRDYDIRYEDYEIFEQTYTTKNNDEIVVFGYYGSDY